MSKIKGVTKNLPSTSSSIREDNTSHTNREPSSNGREYVEQYKYITEIIESKTIPSETIYVQTNIGAYPIITTPSITLPFTISKKEYKRERTISELFDEVDKVLGKSIYGQALSKRFRNNTGTTIIFELSNWGGSKALLQPIKERLKKEEFSIIKGETIDINKEVNSAFKDVSFRFTPIANYDEMVAFGGIQGISVEGSSSNYEAASSYWDKNGNIHHKKSKVDITLDIYLQDWFGVDDNDFSAADYSPVHVDIHKPKNIKDMPISVKPNINGSLKSLVTMWGREALTCFWILQHQKGYKPFIQQLKFRTTFKIEFES